VKILLKKCLGVCLLIANASILGMQTQAPVAAPVAPIHDFAELLNLRHEHERLSQAVRSMRGKQSLLLKMGLGAVGLISLVVKFKPEMTEWWLSCLCVAVLLSVPLPKHNWLLNHCLLNWFSCTSKLRAEKHQLEQNILERVRKTRIDNDEFYQNMLRAAGSQERNGFFSCVCFSGHLQNEVMFRRLFAQEAAIQGLNAHNDDLHAQIATLQRAIQVENALPN